METDIPNWRARLDNALGDTLVRARDYEGAVAAYNKACERAPNCAFPWENLAFALMKTREWSRSLEAVLRALALDARRRDARVYRTAGLAATALGDWQRARWAWREAGVVVTSGEGPIEDSFGLAAVRVGRTIRPTEVWCQRIDPVRGHLIGVPPPATGRRHADLILHEAEVIGEAQQSGVTWPLFEEILVLELSAYRTWDVDVVAPTAADLNDLSTRCAEAKVWIEDWTPGPPFSIPWRSWVPARRLGVAARERRDFEVLSRWQAASPDRHVGEPHLLLGEGSAHE